MIKKYNILGELGSYEEYLIYHWFKELKDADYIKNIIFQPNSIIWYSGLEKRSFSVKQLKTKVKKVYSKDKYLIKPRKYTPDFEITWNTKDNPFVQSIELFEIDKNIPFIIKDKKSFIEIKAEYNAQNMTRMFTSHIQPELYNNKNMYIQLIKPFSLFRDTFIPKMVLTDFFYKKSGKWGKKGDKKYKWKYKTLNEYLKKTK